MHKYCVMCSAQRYRCLFMCQQIYRVYLCEEVCLLVVMYIMCTCTTLRIYSMFYSRILLPNNKQYLRSSSVSISIQVHKHTYAPVNKCIEVLMIKMPDIMVISKKSYVQTVFFVWPCVVV